MTEATAAQDDRDLSVTGPRRVDLQFEPAGTRVRVPPGVTLFDAASWHGIAIDSTCGGHGTC
jgi:ferredoxin